MNQLYFFKDYKTKSFVANLKNASDKNESIYLAATEYILKEFDEHLTITNSTNAQLLSSTITSGTYLTNDLHVYKATQTVTRGYISYFNTNHIQFEYVGCFVLQAAQSNAVTPIDDVVWIACTKCNANCYYHYTISPADIDDNVLHKYLCKNCFKVYDSK